MPGRSLTEELERLEQSITLTLQGAPLDPVSAPFTANMTQKSTPTLARLIELLPPAYSQLSSSMRTTPRMCGKDQRFAGSRLCMPQLC